MMNMTRIDEGAYLVLGCELLSEFRRNGSAKWSKQQAIVNPADGFVWVSNNNYSGLNPAGVYILWFHTRDDDGYPTPVFSVLKRNKYGCWNIAVNMICRRDYTTHR